MIYLPGGPSHMDMYDLKPDAPAEFRGEFKPIQTNVPGVQICEHFPLQARMWDKLACIRSIVSVDEHSDSLVHDRLQRTRQPHRRTIRPSARWSSKRAQRRQRRRPAFVSLRGMSRRHRTRLPRHLASAVHAERPGRRKPAARRRRQADRVDDRRELLATSTTVRRDIDASGTMHGLDYLHRPRLRHDRLGHRPQGSRPEPRRSTPSRDRYQGRRAIPHRPPAGRSGRRLRHARLRRLGYARRKLHRRCVGSCPMLDAASPT